MKVLSIILSLLLMSVSVSASQYEYFLEDDDPISSELSEILSDLPDLSSILPETSADTADVGTDTDPTSFSLSSSPSSGLVSPLDLTYGGAWSGSVLDYFSGVMRGHPFQDYVCFRRDQYTYVLYYGVDISCTGGVFQGSDLNLITYNTYNNYGTNEYVSFSYNQNLNYTADGIFYSNVYDNAALLEGVRSIEYIIVVCVLVCVLLFVSVIRMFFKTR